MNEEKLFDPQRFDLNQFGSGLSQLFKILVEDHNRYLWYDHPQLLHCGLGQRT